MSIARDGTGGVVYLKQVSGVDFRVDHSTVRENQIAEFLTVADLVAVEIKIAKRNNKTFMTRPPTRR